MDAPLVIAESICTSEPMDSVLQVSGEIRLIEACKHPEGSIGTGRFIRVWLGPLCSFEPITIQLDMLEVSPSSCKMSFTGTQVEDSSAAQAFLDQLSWSESFSNSPSHGPDGEDSDGEDDVSTSYSPSHGPGMNYNLSTAQWEANEPEPDPRLQPQPWPGESKRKIRLE
jgi:hypothetical protein